MGRKLFGTDGIRGVAGEPPLDAATVFAAGVSLGRYLSGKGAAAGVILGEDTRESSRWIAETVAAGLQEAGVSSVSAGVLPTPGLACLTASGDYAAGIMISASHNPYQDNGIKVFASSGYKLPDEGEWEVERGIFEMLGTMPGDGSGVHPRRMTVEPDRTLAARYMEFLRRTAGTSWSLPGKKLVLDCAYGAASAVAREVFSGRGMELKIICDQPNGRNINLDCGALHLGNLQRRVVEEKADAGVAFDGDADRAMFVTARGAVVNGDGVLLAASRFLQERNLLKGGGVVGTLMTNLGLERALARRGLKLLRTPVGDKYVLEEMLRSGMNLGGEQSGHIIFSDLATTGDGLLTALEMLRILAETGQTLEQAVADLQVFPQMIQNVRVREKVPLETLPRVMEAIRSSEEQLGERGRVAVRYSGTELLARVMVEAQTEQDVQRHTAALVRAIEESLGSGGG